MFGILVGVITLAFFLVKVLSPKDTPNRSTSRHKPRTFNDTTNISHNDAQAIFNQYWNRNDTEVVTSTNLGSTSLAIEDVSITIEQQTYPVIVMPNVLQSLKYNGFNVGDYDYIDGYEVIKAMTKEQQMRCVLDWECRGNRNYFKAPSSTVQYSAQPTKGKSESWFANYLRRYTDNVVYIDKKLQHFFPKDPCTERHHESDIISHYYYPDMIVIDESSSIVIDIEIDEPYSHTTGEPIHFLNTMSKKESYVWCNDDYRDECFSASGIWTIRFAEEQIVRHPRKCIEVICRLIDAYRSNPTDIDYETITEPLSKTRSVQRWTYDEAIELSKSNHRETYLGQLNVSATKQHSIPSTQKVTFGPIEDETTRKELAKELWALMNKTETHGTK